MGEARIRARRAALAPGLAAMLVLAFAALVLPPAPGAAARADAADDARAAGDADATERGGAADDDAGATERGARSLAHGAGAVHVAVASSFAPTARALAADFQAASGHTVVLSEGSTGRLYAQIANGAPFEAFLAADAERPRRLEAEGYAVAGTRFAYALGRLALWSRDPERVRDAGALRGDFRHLAIANPALAPYGAAARETLERLGPWASLAPRLVTGEDVGQAFQFVATGNAELGFVALAQVLDAGGSRWEVPADLHAPIVQEAVLLARGRDDPAARAFLAFLRGPAARARIESAGYAVPDAARTRGGDEGGDDAMTVHPPEPSP